MYKGVPVPPPQLCFFSHPNRDIQTIPKGYLLGVLVEAVDVMVELVGVVGVDVTGAEVLVLPGRIWLSNESVFTIIFMVVRTSKINFGVCYRYW